MTLKATRKLPETDSPLTQEEIDEVQRSVDNDRDCAPTERKPAREHVLGEDPMTEAEFEKRMGRLPQHDDLERINCKEAGKPLHYGCGWCTLHAQPRFICLCPVEVRKLTKEALDAAFAPVNALLVELMRQRVITSVCFHEIRKLKLSLQQELFGK